MKMHCGRLVALVVIGWASMVAGATPAIGQELRTLAQGHFTLPHEVHWKSSILPPGDYTFELRGNSLWMTIGLHGPGGNVRVSGPTIDSEPSKESSKLKIEHRDGLDYVRDLYLAPIGLHVRYTVPKPSRNDRILAKRQGGGDRVTIATR